MRLENPSNMRNVTSALHNIKRGADISATLIKTNSTKYTKLCIYKQNFTLDIYIYFVFTAPSMVASNYVFIFNLIFFYLFPKFQLKLHSTKIVEKTWIFFVEVREWKEIT